MVVFCGLPVNSCFKKQPSLASALFIALCVYASLKRRWLRYARFRKQSFRITKFRLRLNEKHCRRNLSIAPAEFIVCLSYSFSINRQLSCSLFTGTSILMALQPYLPGGVNLMFSFIFFVIMKIGLAQIPFL